MEEAVALHYWLSNVPVRLAFLFGLTGYVYLFKEGGVFGSAAGSWRNTSIGEPLQNSLVFTFGFFEVAIWFWIFTSLREERREALRKRVEAAKAEADHL
ncbi:hypothetical protein PRZ48_008067 [Zasmidium cellare]|uniref:Uncharacterized protein n=1 Tax=Zasmidium cellare TaxID=395010 RepID=A0ABR0EF65_ZASCE|nr:hypothetical protein PRZ48_008067 [Zasmidium cellare]